VLIHLEQAFADNIHTARGQAVHHLVDTPGYEIKPGVRLERALPLWRDRMNLIGRPIKSIFTRTALRPPSSSSTAPSGRSCRRISSSPRKRAWRKYSTPYAHRRNFATNSHGQ